MAKTILIIEDNAMLQAAYAMKFKEFNIITVGNGKEGLEMLKTVKPDLIILDIFMPEMDGEEFLQKVDKPSPIIVVTNSESDYNGKVDAKLNKMTTSLSQVYDTVKQYL